MNRTWSHRVPLRLGVSACGAAAAVVATLHDLQARVSSEGKR
jgi:hypothetical protein